MQFIGAPHRTNHPHFLANPEKQGTKNSKECQQDGGRWLSICRTCYCSTHYIT